jgi:hypothetical protein
VSPNFPALFTIPADIVFPTPNREGISVAKLVDIACRRISGDSGTVWRALAVHTCH